MTFQAPGRSSVGLLNARIVPLNPEQTTPKHLGYRLPAEWEPHEATWLSWPHKEASWPGKIGRIFPVYAQMVAALARSEAVHINVNDAEMEAAACRLLEQAGARTGAGSNIRFHRFPTNDAWCRDHGAIILTHRDASRAAGASRLSSPRLATDWDYNAWGDKYPPYDLDNLIPAKMADFLGIPCQKGGMVLEGGSIDSNGAGLLLTTESCLLNPNRNPRLTRAQIEARLARSAGRRKNPLARRRHRRRRYRRPYRRHHPVRQRASRRHGHRRRSDR